MDLGCSSGFFSIRTDTSADYRVTGGTGRFEGLSGGPAIRGVPGFGDAGRFVRVLGAQRVLEGSQILRDS